MTTRGAWSREAGPPWCVPAAAVVVLVLAVLALTNGAAWWMWCPLVVAVLTAGCGLVRVGVNARGVRVTCGPLPIRTIALNRIVEAKSGYARLADMGGFGYRITPGRHAVALRPGDALWLTLVSGREFVVTVDDAVSAARLVNRLREEESRDAGGDRRGIDRETR
ncbi:hypothetical protein ABII15_29160 [Streptomyces sp. HUAS MG91]|uniref:Lipoprotein n=1 Tax=Streptomyces tabacisoli TaxID=3156398 RepID=A0AAU8IZP7_9ACTN